MVKAKRFKGIKALEFLYVDIDDVLINFLDKDIKVRQFVDVETKMKIVNLIINVSFGDVDGAKKYNPIVRDIMFVYCLLEYYTDLKVPDNKFYEVYDLATKSGLVNELLSNIPEKELNNLNKMLEESLEEEYKYLDRKGSFVNTVTQLTEAFVNFDINDFTNKVENLKNADILKGIFAEQING